MSGNEDVLDNWEEIDESMLNNQIHQIRRGITTTELVQQNGLTNIMMPSDDYYANSYTQSAKPIVTILRRPAQNTETLKLCESKPKQPIKTLQQREQEYAQARLRILGSAKNPEDEQESSVAPTMESSTHVSSETKSYDRAVGDSLSMSQNVNQIYNPHSVVRMPKGPDGSPGFMFRR